MGTAPVVGVGGATAREYQVGGVAVAPGWRPPAVQVRRDRDRQLVTVAHNDLATAAALDGGTREDPIVAPERRREPGQDLGLSFLGRDLVVVRGARAQRARETVRSGFRTWGTDSGTIKGFGNCALLRSRFPVVPWPLP
jgi:hypothetical protein